ncbi:hypothetical protein HMPREF9553_03023, partial [Escherichia coli MS 200-1]
QCRGPEFLPWCLSGSDTGNDVNAMMFDCLGDADDFLDCFIIPARIVGGTFWG